MEEFSNLNFNHYVNLFTSSNDIVSLQELYLLKERCPEFNFCKYKVGIFTLPNIEKFGQDFLLANYEWLTQSILELSIIDTEAFVHAFDGINSSNFFKDIWYAISNGLIALFGDFKAFP